VQKRGEARPINTQHVVWYEDRGERKGNGASQAAVGKQELVARRHRLYSKGRLRGETGNQSDLCVSYYNMQTQEKSNTIALTRRTIPETVCQVEQRERKYEAEHGEDDEGANDKGRVPSSGD
jgi:hypothetical protein